MRKYFITFGVLMLAASIAWGQLTVARSAAGATRRHFEENIKVYWLNSNGVGELLTWRNNKIACVNGSNCNVPTALNVTTMLRNLTDFSGEPAPFQLQLLNMSLQQPELFPLRIFLIDDRGHEQMPDYQKLVDMHAITADQNVRVCAINNGTGNSVIFGAEYLQTTGLADFMSEFRSVLFNCASLGRGQTRDLLNISLSPIQGAFRMAYMNPNAAWASLEPVVGNYIPDYADLPANTKKVLQVEFNTAKEVFQQIGLSPNSNVVIQPIIEQYNSANNEAKRALYRNASKAGMLYFHHAFDDYMSRESQYGMEGLNFLTLENFEQNWCNIRNDKMLQVLAEYYSNMGRIPLSAGCRQNLAALNVQVALVTPATPQNMFIVRDQAISVPAIQLGLLLQRSYDIYNRNRGLVSRELSRHEFKNLSLLIQREFESKIFNQLL